MSGAKIVKAMEEAAAIAPWVARVQELEASLASERQTATLNAEAHTRAIRALEDMVEAEAEARREAEGECALWRQMVERMEEAGKAMIAAARPFIRQDPALGVAWSKLRGAMPLRIYGSAEPTAPPPVPSSSKT